MMVIGGASYVAAPLSADIGGTPEAYYTEKRVHPQANNLRARYDRPGWLRCELLRCELLLGWPLVCWPLLCDGLPPLCGALPCGSPLSPGWPSSRGSDT